MASLVSPLGNVCNNKATTLKKNDADLISDTNVDVQSVGGRDRNEGVDLSFYKSAECLILSKMSKELLCV